VKRLYLDQCHVIRLEAAALGQSGDAKAHEALEAIRYGVQNGLLSVPLSAVHYMETYGRPTSRATLARLLSELSGLDRIAPPSAVVPAELDRVLAERYGKPTEPRPLQLFGEGWRFAFGQPDSPYQAPTGLKWEPGAKGEFEEMAQETIEHALLAGPPDGVPIPGWSENDGYRRWGERQAAHEQSLSVQLWKNGQPSATTIRDVVAATEVIDIQQPLNEAFGRAGISAAESSELDSKDGLTELLRALPSRDVIFELRRLRHADRTARWEANDLEDFSALSVALPYCDVVVTEKQWRHLSEQAGIPSKYGTVVLSSLGDVAAHVVS
jgi:hypothetical protein